MAGLTVEAVRASDRFGAFCDHVDVEVGGADAGPLAGMEFAAKDLFDVVAYTCCAGNPDWLGSHAPASSTAPAIERVLAAGGTLIGKTRCDELAYSISGRNARYGTPTNPAAPGRLPGGSSSGSAAAVAGGLVDFALGTDTTGSIRTPAALCGICAMRVTWGAVPVGGVVPLAPSFDTVGALATDLLLLHDVYDVLIEAVPVSPAWKRAIFPAEAWDLADPDVRAELELASRAIDDALPIERCAISDDGLGRWADDVSLFQASEIWAVHGQWVRTVEPIFGPDVQQRMQAASRVEPEEAEHAHRSCGGAGHRVRDQVGDDTVVVFPTSPSVAPPADASEGDLSTWRRSVMALTSIANVSGLPQLAIPAGRIDGLPVSLSLLGPAGADLALVDLAIELGLGRE